MATRSKPKNFPSEQQPKRGQLKDMPGPSKPHPGYPGYGPPLPGKDYMGVTPRTPSGVEKYYPQWSSSNIKNNQVAESERLTAERLLQETKELISETKLKARQDAKEVDTRFRQRVSDIEFWKSELEG